MKDLKISLDSNSITYLVQVSKSLEKPSGSLADEKTALFRVFLFLEDVFYITPTVMAEILAIIDKTNRNNHLEWIDIHFENTQPGDEDEIKKRTTELQKYHKGIKKYKDCLAIAESEIHPCDYFLTYDSDLLKNLRRECPYLNLLRPTEFWSILGIKKGTRPAKIPTTSNPLSEVDWWLW